MYRKLLGMVAVASVALASAQAHAAVNCTGTATRSYVTTSGSVVFQPSWASSPTVVCMINQTWKGVPPDVCVTWLAKLDAAVSLSRQITVRYEDLSECTAILSYHNAPGPTYVMLN